MDEKMKSESKKKKTVQGRKEKDEDTILTPPDNSTLLRRLKELPPIYKEARAAIEDVLIYREHGIQRRKQPPSRGATDTWRVA